jgi:hypothetical protein
MGWFLLIPDQHLHSARHCHLNWNQREKYATTCELSTLAGHMDGRVAVWEVVPTGGRLSPMAVIGAAGGGLPIRCVCTQPQLFWCAFLWCLAQVHLSQGSKRLVPAPETPGMLFYLLMIC